MVIRRPPLTWDGKTTSLGSVFLNHSIGISTSQELEASTDENSQIEPEIPIFDVPKVTLDSSLHQFNLSSLAPIAVDLSPSREPRLHMLSQCIFRDHLGVAVVVRDSVRSRPYE